MKICKHQAMRICEHQEYCIQNHKYIGCTQKGCIYGYCSTCKIDYNPDFDCSKLPDSEDDEV